MLTQTWINDPLPYKNTNLNLVNSKSKTKDLTKP